MCIPLVLLHMRKQKANILVLEQPLRRWNRKHLQLKQKGEESGEGFVFTTEKNNAKDKLTFQVSLEGKGTVFVKLVETDANGIYIKEHRSPMILLTSEWKEYHITTNLNKVTNQVDVLVITEGIQQTEFKFRDVNILK